MSRAQDLFDFVADQGEAAIDALIAGAQTEEFFLDFKRSGDDGAGVRLHHSDVKNLRKAISGFGNGEGGVIIWGVDCPSRPDGDFARARVPLRDARRFSSLLQRASSGATVPPHPTVEHRAIHCADGTSGYVISLIPRSALAPHQNVETLQYHLRVGGEFLPMQHSILRGMFGHPDPPVLNARWDAHPPIIWPCNPQENCVTLRVGFVLVSAGPGVMRDIFVSVDARADAELNEEVVELSAGTGWEVSKLRAGRVSLVTSDGFKLGPEGAIRPLLLRLVIAPGRSTVDFSYRMALGFHGGPTQIIEHCASASIIEATRASLVGGGDEAARADAYRNCFGIEPRMYVDR